MVKRPLSLQRAESRRLPLLCGSMLFCLPDSAQAKAEPGRGTHESLNTTYRHYADPGIAEQHEHRRVMDSLAPDSSASVER